MAKAIQCDVCGKFFRDDIPDGESRTRQIDFIESFSNNLMHPFKHSYDICDDCYVAIMNLLDERGLGKHEV